MLNFNSLNLGTMQFDVMKKFYQEVIGQKPVMEQGKMVGWVVGTAYLGVMEHSEMEGKNPQGARVMFNLETTDVKGEFERISKIEGLQVIKEPYGMDEKGEEGDKFWIATLADPDGNYFQLVTPWDEGK
jgi:predicted enzyme related to lactoylglutathione lyase